MSIIEQKGKPPYNQVVKTLTDYIVTCSAAATADSFSSITILISGKHSNVSFNGSNEFHETIIINNRLGVPMPEKEMKEFFEKLFLHLASHGISKESLKRINIGKRPIRKK